MCHPPTSAVALTPTLTKGLTPLQQRGPCPPKSPAPNSAPVVYREGVGEIPSDAPCTGWGDRSIVTVQLNTDTIWREIGMNHSYQGAELKRARELWPLTLCIDSWTVLTLRLIKWEAVGWMIMNKH